MARLNSALLLLGGAALAASCAISGASIDPSLDNLGATGGAAGKTNPAGGASGKGQASAGDSGASNDTGGEPARGGTSGAPGAGTGGEPMTSAGTAGSPAGGGGMTAGSGGTAGGGTAGSGGTSGATGEVTCPATVVGHCEAGVAYPTYTGYTLALVEDFPVALDLDNDPIFTWSDGIPQDGQTAFRKASLTFNGGRMLITASNDCTGTAKCIAPHSSYADAISGMPDPVSEGAAAVWSGELRSKYDNYRYGRYEMKAKGPVPNPGQESTDSFAGNALFSLFVFRTPRNLIWNEIDFELEPYQHSKVSGNTINATNAVSYPAANASAWSVAGPGAYKVSDEHVYAFSWTPTAINWYVDGTLVKTYSGSGPPIPTASAKIMMNMWVFGSSAAFGDPANNHYPFSASVDYFHFYSWDTDGTYPCKPAPACLPMADKLAVSQNNSTEVNYGL